MKPRDITGHVLSRPLRSPYVRGRAPSKYRWLWIVVAAWALWVVGLFSDHGFWRISRLRQELRSATGELARVKAETSRLDARLHDPVASADHAEEALRRQGMARPGEIIYRFDARSAADSTVR